MELHIIYSAWEGNGYHCGCCRRDWEDKDDFSASSLEDAREQMIEIAVRQLNNSQDDWSLSEIKIIGGASTDELDTDEIMAEARKRWARKTKIDLLKKELKEIEDKIDGYDRVFLAKTNEARKQLDEELITQKGYDKLFTEAGEAHNTVVPGLINRRTRISEELEALGA